MCFPKIEWRLRFLSRREAKYSKNCTSLIFTLLERRFTLRHLESTLLCASAHVLYYTRNQVTRGVELRLSDAVNRRAALPFLGTGSGWTRPRDAIRMQNRYQTETKRQRIGRPWIAWTRFKSQHDVISSIIGIT